MTLKVPRELWRRESDSTEIAMAFVLPNIIHKSPSDNNDDDDDDGNESTIPSAQNVFAYLPLRSYGLKFIIQADWKVWHELLRQRGKRLYEHCGGYTCGPKEEISKR